MIDPKELRIGNVIGWKTGVGELIIGELFEVHSDKVAISAPLVDGDIEGQGFMGVAGIEPIPLTTEWIKRCGMEYRKEDKVWQIQIGNTNYFEIEAEEPFMCGVTPETWRDQSPVYIWAEVKHVHQLQNIFFALTGEELNLTNQ